MDTLKSRDQLLNVPENNFTQMARQHNWEAIKRGWPDFICIPPQKDKQPFVVEVKPRVPTGPRKGCYGMLKPEQEYVMAMLQDLGMKVYISDGESLDVFDREYWKTERKKYGIATKTMRVKARSKPSFKVAGGLAHALSLHGQFSKPAWTVFEHAIWKKKGPPNDPAVRPQRPARQRGDTGCSGSR